MINRNISSFSSNILDNFSIINIYGGSGTRKTTLALQLVSNFIITTRKKEISCIRIQTSEKFPKKRLISMYSRYPSHLTYLEDKIFIFPKNNISDYKEQNQFLK